MVTVGRHEWWGRRVVLFRKHLREMLDEHVAFADALDIIRSIVLRVPAIKNIKGRGVGLLRRWSSLHAQKADWPAERSCKVRAVLGIMMRQGQYTVLSLASCDGAVVCVGARSRAQRNARRSAAAPKARALLERHSFCGLSTLAGSRFLNHCEARLLF